MKERINDKIKQIEEFLETLLEIRPLTFEDYMRDMKTKAACERYAQKVIEAIIDLAYLIIKYGDLKMPEEDEQVFYVLVENNILSKDLGERLQEAKGMRNFLVHEYGEVDDNIIFNALSEELEKDVKEFLDKIKITLKDENKKSK